MVGDKNRRLTQDEIGKFIRDNLPEEAWVAYNRNEDWEDDFQSPQDGLQHIYWEKGEWHQEWMSWPAFMLESGILHVGVYINYGPGDQAELSEWDEVLTAADLELGYTYEQQERDAAEYIEWVIENAEDPLEYFSVGMEDRESEVLTVRVTLDAAAQEAWVERTNGGAIGELLGKSVGFRLVGDHWSAINGDWNISYDTLAELDGDHDGVIEHDFGQVYYDVPKSQAEYEQQLVVAAKNALERMKKGE